MSLKIRYLHSHLEFFTPNFIDVAKEHGEHFYQDIHIIEKRYQKRWEEAMMGDHVWTLIEDDKEMQKRSCYLWVHF